MALIIKGFVTEKLIKEGGFGSVYLVRKVIDKKTPLALKILNPKTATQFYSRSLFQKEVKLLMSLNHPYIVKVYNFVQDAPRPAMLMEYFDGDTIKDLTMGKNPILQEKGLGIFRKCLEALKYLHEKGIIHKDLKPENIIVSQDGDVRIVDFSIAEKENIFSFFKIRKREGTPLYMSPEQIRKQKLDARTDIYSLGATFYEAFSGRAHISASSEKSLLQKQLKAPVPKIRTFNKVIPYQIDNILLRMLEKEPEARYQSMSEIIFNLNKFSTGEKLNIDNLVEEDKKGT